MKANTAATWARAGWSGSSWANSGPMTPASYFLIRSESSKCLPISSITCRASPCENSGRSARAINSAGAANLRPRSFKIASKSSSKTMDKAVRKLGAP